MSSFLVAPAPSLDRIPAARIQVDDGDRPAPTEGLEMSDAEVAAGLRDSGEVWLAEAWGRWASLVRTISLWSLGNREEAEDVTQIVSANVWRRRSRYDASTGTLAGWLVGIVRRTIVDRCSAVQRQRQVVSVVSAVSEADPVVSAPGDAVTDRVLLTTELPRLGHPAQRIMELASFHDVAHADRREHEAAARYREEPYPSVVGAVATQVGGGRCRTLTRRPSR